jgi:nucleotide-binding universal stress UspA family protein
VKDLVVGIDGSTTSWRALSMAVGIATRYKACVHVCFVLHTPAAAEMGVFAIPATVLVEDDDGTDLGRQVTEELNGADVKGDFTCLKGDIARELEVLAESCRADVIVVGRSRHPALHPGGVPRRLLAMGRRPVLVVP